MTRPTCEGSTARATPCEKPATWHLVGSYKYCTDGCCGVEEVSCDDHLEAMKEQWKEYEPFLTPINEDGSHGEGYYADDED